MCALPYFDVHDCLSVVDGILAEGEAVVIPQALRPSTKRRLHSAHLGRDSMLCRARRTVYWPNIASDIKQISDMCETCQEMKPRNPPEPLRQHSDGDEPRQKIGLDLFESAGKHYLAVVDYYSNDCVGRRSTVYQSGVKFFYGGLRYKSCYLITNASEGQWQSKTCH